MFLFRLTIHFVILVTLISFVISVEKYRKPGKTLYVIDDKANSGRKLTVINNEKSESSTLESTSTINIPPVERNISTWITHLNDDHQQLMVNWVEGSNVIICLARDSTPRNNAEPSPSTLFISYDNGKIFTNKTENFRLGDTPDSGYAQVDTFFNHPRYHEFCVFTDSVNKKLYYTSDNGRNIYRSDLSFSPSELAFDEEFPDKYVILDEVDSKKKLYLTLDGGKTFKMIQSNVKTFFWLSGPGLTKVFYVERWKPDGTSSVFTASDPTDLINTDVLFEEAKDFQIKGDYMFATKQSKERNTLHLYISHQRGPFIKTEFQTELDLRKFHIADVTEKRIFVSVMHTESLANLYVSEIGKNFTQYNFVLSLEQVLCYFPDGNWRDTWLQAVTEEPFTDLYRVEGLKGIYIASQVDSKTSVPCIGPEHLVSLITFDHGVTWSPIKPPTEDENGKPLNCHIEKSCSLHLYQRFGELYPPTRSLSIKSSKSAPGIIMATGVMGKSLKGDLGVYMSRDAGLTWRRILKDFYIFNYGDHGGILVAVKYFKSRGETRRILYSTNEGVEWNAYQFKADDLRIYRLMTEPGKNSTTFTMFGSTKDQHQWIIKTIDLKNTFARNCTQDDYKFWSPSPPHSSVSCVLGTKNVFQRRLAHTDCYNGIDYQRSVKKEVCECTRRDYKCDFGFMLLGEECIQNKSVKYEPYAVPSDCRPGQYYMQTKGYRKIDGNVCTVSGYSGYAPEMIPCPIEQQTEFMLVAIRDKIVRIDLTNNVTSYPVEGQRNIIALEFDVKNNCIYWSDVELYKNSNACISRQCFNNGSHLEIIVDTDLASIEGMALDWISNVLFFVDDVRRKIEAVSTYSINESRMRVTILDNKVLGVPRGIAVHPKAGYLFWTDWDADTPSISRSNLDGTDIKKLFEKPTVYWPNGMTVDQVSERIYWAESRQDYIGISDLNGQYFRRILWNNEKVANPFAVAVVNDKVYWDDWNAKSIFIADKDTGLNVVTLYNSSLDMMDLKVFAHSVQHGSNACSFKNITCNALCLGMPGNNNYSCLCPDGFKNINGSCVFSDDVEPFANMTSPKTTGETYDDVTTCGTNRFSCIENDTIVLCIPTTWVCDSDRDCPDGSDESEERCKRNPTCPSFMFKCSSGKCIPRNWVCDGENDCDDRESSDERNCTNIGHSKQLPESNTETPIFPNGTKNCLSWMVTCDNGNCVPKWWKCDGYDDCGDYSDENGCQLTLPETKPLNSDHSLVQLKCENQFTCSPDMCIPLAWACNGIKDCPDGVDERDCALKTRPEVMCASNETLCADMKSCFKNDEVCDGVPQCADHSDEIHCPMIPYLNISVDQSSINSTSFLTSCWIRHQKMVVYSFLPSISKVSDGKWTNMSWINDSTYRFTDLEPYTNYNVTFYIRDSKSNKTYASNKYVNTSTGQGVPSPPRDLKINQLIGSRVEVIWNQPENPNGAIQYYELYYSPPTPSIMKTVPANNTNEQSVIFKGLFKPNGNYSFWVKAVNNAYTSNSSEVIYLTFDDSGDVDDFNDVIISRPNASAVFLKWNRIRGVEGYSIRLRLPVEYVQRDIVTTKNNNITLTNLPPGVRLYIDIQAYKNSVYGESFTISLSTQGEPDETLNLTAILLKEKQTSVQLSWSPPNGERYKNKELQYEVRFVNIIRNTYPVEMSNDTKIITKDTSIVIDDLHASERYLFCVGLLGGPLSNLVDITTKENIK